MSRNVVIHGRRTSMRLEPTLWDALSEIAARERMTVNALCSSIQDRMSAQLAARRGPGAARRDGPPLDHALDKVGAAAISLTGAVRVLIAAYFRQAARQSLTAERRPGGDLFEGTPFAVAGDAMIPPDRSSRPRGEGGAPSQAT
ncbi:hypothetical protein ABAZ39_13105 [Azospirillum argentinense]|uniref:Ribbon-helix-helix domain-containing protein n=1 Tax=Azospirillum argentinense TaxID=2970906 RepID=A0A060DP93_9PROT|nr:hypothetical protein ABAZ39_13105 [Azospirillum argentinense]EZQ09650.1 hypothetical protein ABAZ39_14515 [Azospirillum argentinense]